MLLCLVFSSPSSTACPSFALFVVVLRHFPEILKSILMVEWIHHLSRFISRIILTCTSITQPLPPLSPLNIHIPFCRTSIPINTRPFHPRRASAALQLAFSLLPSVPRLRRLTFTRQVKFCQSSRPFISHSIKPADASYCPYSSFDDRYYGCSSRRVLPSLNINFTTTLVPACLLSRTFSTANQKKQTNRQE